MRAGWRLAAPARWMGRQVLEGRGGQEEKLSRAMRELLEREAAFEALNAEACARARVRACAAGEGKGARHGGGDDRIDYLASTQRARTRAWQLLMYGPKKL